MLSGQMLIGGKWTDAKSKKVLQVTDPVNNEPFAQVPDADTEDIMEAVKSAKEAFPAWSNTNPFYRGKMLRVAAELIRQNKDSIAKLMTMEQGKPLKEATGEVEKGADILAYYAEEGERVYGRIVPNADGNDIVSHVIYQPVGVVACISPWNYPIELLAWKVGAAMAAGCTCIMKIPSETPLSPIEFIKTMEKAGFPEGVINVVSGSGSKIGPILSSHPDIKKLAFTGSTPVGKDIMEKSSGTLKRLSLELGGSLPMIVCADCNLQEAVKGAVRRSFRNMGQICIAVNRIYVAREIYEEFLKLFAESTKKLTVGHGLTDDCDLGPMCTKKGMDYVIKQIENAVSCGAKVICGGKRPDGSKFEKGNFLEPTIIRDVNHDMMMMREETFGPAVGVMPFDTVEEVISLANDTSYGLAAIAYTNNLSLADRFTKELNAGNVAINNVDAGVINAPYGGWNESGFGLEHGPEGLYQYFHTKHVRIKTYQC